MKRDAMRMGPARMHVPVYAALHVAASAAAA